MTALHERKRKPGSGRKALYDAPMGRVNLPVTSAQRAKLVRLGGAAWVRQQIDATPEPLPTPALRAHRAVPVVSASENPTRPC